MSMNDDPDSTLKQALDVSLSAFQRRVLEPRRASTWQSIVKTLSTAPQRPHVLYVEDEPSNVEVAELWLGQAFSMTSVPNAEQAIAVLRAQGAQVDAVLIDLELKGSALDGLQLTQLLRGTLPAHLGFEGVVAPSQLPIIAVTAHAREFPEVVLRAAGVERYFTKPVDFSRLTAALTDVIRPRDTPR